MRLKLLDLFCGSGGSAMGYYRAGFDIVGVDIKPKPDYPFPMLIGDALEVNPRGFDVIHASPPCQMWSTSTSITGDRSKHRDLVKETRKMLVKLGKPYVIENVPRAPLVDPIVLCGSMFGLGVRRHRKFEVSIPVPQPMCAHHLQPEVVGVHGHPGGVSKRGDRKHTLDQWKEAMGIDWMSARQLAQAIPPAYTEYIGVFLRDMV